MSHSVMPKRGAKENCSPEIYDSIHGFKEIMWLVQTHRYIKFGSIANVSIFKISSCASMMTLNLASAIH